MLVLTKSKLILLLFVFALLKTINSFSQSPAASFADTVFVYKGFGVGGTTASLWYYSHAVDTNAQCHQSAVNEKISRYAKLSTRPSRIKKTLPAKDRTPVFMQA